MFFSNNKELKGYARNENEGLKYVIQASEFLYNNKKFGEIVYLIIDTFVRFVGYKVGFHYRNFPGAIIRRVSMNKNYWDTIMGCDRFA